MSSSRRSKYKEQDRPSGSTCQTTWSKWMWDEAGSRWYQHRQNSQDQDEYKFSEPTSTTRYSTSAPLRPIYSASPSFSYGSGLPGITHGMSSVSINEPAASKDNPATDKRHGVDTGHFSSYATFGYPTRSYSTAYSVPIVASTSCSKFSSTNPRSLYGYMDGSTRKYVSAPSYLHSFANPTWHSVFAKPQNHSTLTKSTTQNSQTTTEHLDTNFKVHRSSDFTTGKVFEVLWAEQGSSSRTQDLRKRSSGVADGGVDSGIRRFVVVKNERDYETCLEIHTYQGRGTLQPGVSAEHRSVIFTSPKDGPYCLNGEESLGMNLPIRITLFNDREDLDAASSLDLSRLYNVGHYMMVQFIGEVAEEDTKELLATFCQAQRAPIGLHYSTTRYERPVNEPIDPRPESPSVDESYSSLPPAQPKFWDPVIHV